MLATTTTTTDGVDDCTISGVSSRLSPLAGAAKRGLTSSRNEQSNSQSDGHLDKTLRGRETSRVRVGRARVARVLGGKLKETTVRQSGRELEQNTLGMAAGAGGGGAVAEMEVSSVQAYAMRKGGRGPTRRP